MESTIPVLEDAANSSAFRGVSLRWLGPKVFDLGGLCSRLERLTDKRKRRGKRYDLVMLLLLVVLAKLSGEDQPAGITDWIANRGCQLRSVLSLTWKRMPSESTFRRILAFVVSPEELDRQIGEYLQSLARVGTDVLISIDGKAVRGTIKWGESRGEHLLAAYLPEQGIVLMQVAAGDRDNEITAAPILLGYLDLRDKVVIGDAIHTQRALSIQILDSSGDYLWFVKENQPTLRQDVVEVFEAKRETVLGGVIESDFQTARTLDKGHGRLETRQITVSSELKGYSDWPGLEQVFRLERRRVEPRSGKEQTETVYGLTSLRRQEASAKRLLYLARAYWGIENGLHGRRDVTFKEDRTRLTRGKAGRVMASLNNLVIGLLSLSGYTNLAQARRWCDAHLTLALAASLDPPLT